MKRTAILCLVLGAACSRDTATPAIPDILSREPEAGSVNASVTGDIRVTFGRPVALPANPNDAVWLEQQGTRVPTSVQLPDHQSVVLTPREVLDPVTSYTVRIGEAVTHAQGSVAPTSWQFTTGGHAVAAAEGARLIAHVRALADDSMRGRRFGSADELKAAGYIATEFERYGLARFEGQGWLQSFPGDGFAGSSQNVIGVVPGAGTLKEQWVVIGAHYDHVGMCNGEICNGADDNASGTAAVLELARTLALHAQGDGFGSPDRRSLMFIAFGAEEAMMIGSGYFTRLPWMPLSSISEMINLDMVGRMRGDSLFVDGLGLRQEWPALLDRYESRLHYSPVNVAGDHRPFRDAGVPALELYTGGHAQYHQPEDDAELINVPGLAQLTTLVAGLVVNLAVRRDAFTP